MPSIAEVLTEAVNDILANGYDSQARIDHWIMAIRMAAQAALGPEADIVHRIRDALNDVFYRQVDRGGLLRRHPGAAKFTIEQVRQHLRAELDRRILAATDLVKLDREQAVANTLRRFRSWSTSIPVGGASGVPRAEVKSSARRPMQNLSFVERRLAIDQAQKLAANLSEILAVDGGALAGEWHHIKPRVGYASRPHHLERQGHWYLMRDSWAHKAGLVRAGKNGYYDDLGDDRAGIPILCSCWMRWAHALRGLPQEMLTAKGRAELERVKATWRFSGVISGVIASVEISPFHR